MWAQIKLHNGYIFYSNFPLLIAVGAKLKWMCPKKIHDAVLSSGASSERLMWFRNVRIKKDAKNRVLQMWWCCARRVSTIEFYHFPMELGGLPVCFHHTIRNSLYLLSFANMYYISILKLKKHSMERRTLKCLLCHACMRSLKKFKLFSVDGIWISECDTSSDEDMIV